MGRDPLTVRVADRQADTAALAPDRSNDDQIWSAVERCVANSLRQPYPQTVFDRGILDALRSHASRPDGAGRDDAVRQLAEVICSQFRRRRREIPGRGCALKSGRNIGRHNRSPGDSTGETQPQ
ncbi:MAG: hypothetical protein DWQ34_00085 [Planctomycetota bacterium]|nr:MAG: hypothetical protein DWQ29_11175 [Planctomycetota bacterium]REJ98643.1 MAG: hypothetical protein DWQ34_00085 [Planctomycetota bacterium]REK26366.1 MAG: hypothetical protein DWQ41_10115 [Planctomycetota bacterium]